MFSIIKTPEQIAKETSKKASEYRIAELKKLLAESDYKAMPDYDKPDSSILDQRQAWRQEIRQLQSLEF
jgi:hypothetical protein